jgi:uncharacterized membrane protein
MSKTRLEAFSDGVIAILITIMVLELHVPDMAEPFTALHEIGLYALSFVLLGIYWNNHHHLLHACTRVNGSILWANLNLLFWLSLVPFGTRWMGDHFEPIPVAAYGVIFLMAGFSWLFLTSAIIAEQGPASVVQQAIGKDWKGRASAVLYAAGIGLAFLSPMLGLAIYIGVALMWFLPDPRIERTLHEAK